MPQKKLWSRDFIAIVVSTLFMGWAFFALMPTLPVYFLDTLKISPGSVGMLVAALPVAAILVRLISGYLIDTYHRVGLLVTSLALVTLGYGIYPLIGSVAAILLLRVVQGAMWGVCTASGATIVADVVPPYRLGQGIGIFALSMPIGMTVGPMFGFALLNTHGPHAMFLAIFGISLLSLLCALFIRGSYKATQRKKLRLATLFHKKAVPISLCMFLIMIAQAAVIVFVGVYAAQKHFPNVATFFLCFAAAVLMSRFCAGRLFDRGYFFHLIAAGHALAAAGMLWLGYTANPVHFLVSGIVGGLGFGTLQPTSQAAVNTLVKSHERGAANSTYLTSYDLGLGVSSLVIGFLAGKMSLGHIYQYCACLIVLSAAIFLLQAIPHFHRNRPGPATVS